MGQTAHPGRTALIAAATLVAAVGLTGCGESVASATTTLTGLVPGGDVRVVHANGQVVAGVDGLRLHRGDVVRTGPGARATLVTRSRHVYEGPNTAVQIVNGAAQTLRAGAVVVDAVHGPGLRLNVAALTIETPAGAATRAERAVTLRVGTLAGSTEVASDTGQQLRLPALDQVVVSGDALPGTPTPLRLTDDYGETHAVPDLVADDKALVSLANGVDSAGAATVRTVAANWSGSLETPPAGVSRSELLLPVAIAAAGHPHDAQQRYGDALGLRKSGGSWGVVAHRLGTDSSAVLAALDRLERYLATGQVGTVPAALSLLTGNGSGGGGGGGKPTAHPSPSPSDSGITGTIQDTVDKVLKLLPSSTPTAVSVPLPAPSLPAVPVVGGLVSPSPTPAPH